MAIISLSAPKGGGKDTVCLIIQLLTEGISKNDIIDSLNTGIIWGGYNDTWQNRKWAQYVKNIASILTGIPVADFEKEAVKNMTFEELYRSGYISKQFLNLLPDE